MASLLPSIPYPPSGDGYWSPVTSTLNWCEEDYYATVYSAEIVNTLTNLLFVWLAFRGINNCIQNGHDQIFLVTFIGYLIVGTGSFLFHSTLKYPMQLVDELSMIYTTCLMFYATFSHKQTRTFRIFLALFLVALCVFITGYYHYLGDPVFHQNMYALLTAIVLFRSMYIMERELRPNPKAREAARKSTGKQDVLSEQEQQRQDERDYKILKTMWLMIGLGLSVFLGGFGIWTLDNVYCSRLPLRTSRQLTLRTMRNPRAALLARSLLLSRPASNTSKPPVPKGRLLEKPTRFNPPSHPARLPRRNRQPAFQVPLSAKDREQQKKKQYPHMLPPEGTFLHWFLTNRNIHVWITMSILISLAFFTWLNNFLANTPYLDQLPPNNMFLSHPIAFLSRYAEVYNLHSQYISAVTAEQRRNKVDDVRKRGEFRKAHGLEEQEGVFGGWSARDATTQEVVQEGVLAGVGNEMPVQKETQKEKEVLEAVVDKEGGAEAYADFEGRRKPIKKWLGIW
ncbi:alkaline ceramidase-like protein [Aureobasidium subglaciale]|nr:alkaline ceramidase-like protein [Aureobasidium subglaciale]